MKIKPSGRPRYRRKDKLKKDYEKLRPEVDYRTAVGKWR